MHIIVLYRIGDYVCYKKATERKLGRILAIVLENSIKKLKIQRILIFDELPNNLRSKVRQQQFRNGALWLLDRDEHDAIVLLDPQAIVQSIAIGDGDHMDGYIIEILYKHNNRWKFRSALLNYRHPSEYAPVQNNNEDDLPVYKLFLDLYYDDFGTYRNVYHSLGGVYLQFGNMPFDI